MAFDFVDLKSKYEQVLALVADDLKGIQTGRAKPSLVEDVMVEAYGTRMPVKELATITAPDPHMIVVAPWDKSVVETIEKALSSGQTQFNPAVDGQVIRIKIAQLTGEKREELIRMVAQRLEGGKQMIRTERNDAKRDVEAQKGQSGISEDNIAYDVEQLDKFTHEYNEKLAEMGRKKEEELSEI